MLNILRNLFPYFCFGSITLSSVLLTHNSVNAQVGASPIVIEAQAVRGRSESIINISNSSDEPIRVSIFAAPFTYNQEGKFQILSSSDWDLSSYLQFSPRELTISPKSSRKIRLLTLLDPNLPDGEYRAVVFAESLVKNNSTNAKNVGMITRVGTTVYIQKGNQTPLLAVSNSSFDEQQNQLRLLVQNQGSASVRTAVSWELKQNGKVIRKGNTQPATIISFSKRNLLIESLSEKSSLLPPGQYELSGKLIWKQNEKSQSLSFQVPVNIGRYVGEAK
ncbi:P pilus assembly protein, chaperone PapD [Rivularia sp. UHCC 0363]|uniref:P pilus assembly protein, chaperone PapD n=1 Tax=Rivularia sp. UHCC 0363 TaxID=3110244 RepID=UPI002B1FCCF4|nr:P pilus assembly protein, chaperone PapD [Rivularia sp. UHCC 0363]MEA5593895.1 P pilus assembly protein, chaperone PapD [Rivularia sp. UHCC 0363]